jgi:hypothetical protein
MPLEGDHREHDPSDAAQQVTTGQGGNSSSSLPPVDGSLDPAPSPPGENHPNQGISKWRGNVIVQR